MTFEQPLAMLALIPLALIAVALWKRAPALVPALPGGWAQLIQAPLRRYMARDLTRPGLGQVWLVLAIAVCLILGIARPLAPLGEGRDWTNQVGRVIVIDSETDGMAGRRIVVDNLIAASPDVPTALVAMAGDAYIVVPFTTDVRQIDRYLRVLAPDAMPIRGMAVHSGVALAEKAIADAGVVIGQIVLVVGPGAPERPVELPETKTLRDLITVGDPTGWQSIAASYGASNTSSTDLSAIKARLDAAITGLRAKLPGAVIDIAPWLFGLAVVLSLGMFRRRNAQ